jgi:hypothetical protein
VLRSRLLSEYGGPVLYEGVPGQVTAKACESASERPPIKGCNDVAVDRFSARLVVSLLPSAFRLLYVALRAKQ